LKNKYLAVIFFCMLAIIIEIALSYFYKPFSNNTRLADNNLSDYQKVAQNINQSSAVCMVVDSKYNIYQTGVLIDDNLVITAAHGVVSMLQNRKIAINDAPCPVDKVNVYFLKEGKNGTKKINVNVASVVVDERFHYENDSNGMYDIAILRLKQPIKKIKPAKFLTNHVLKRSDSLTVLTYTQLNDWGKPKDVLIGFKLYEWIAYHSGKEAWKLNKGRALPIASIYFRPDNSIPKPPEYAPEEVIRVYDATQGWLKDGKQPTYLALPGNSGSPVFVKVGEDYFLFGIVVAYSLLSGGKMFFDANDFKANPEPFKNKYQTIVLPLYSQTSNLNHGEISPDMKGASYYGEDENLKAMINKIKNFKIQN